MSSSSPKNTTPSETPELRRSHWNLLGTVLGPFIALAIVVGFFGIADSLQAEGGSFLTTQNLRTIAVQTATVAVAALGMTVIIIAGGIDLSAGTALALCATVLAWCLKEDVALLVIHGENVASATAKLEEAEDQLSRTQRKLDRLADDASDDERKALQTEQGTLSAAIPNHKATLERVSAASLSLTPWTPGLSVLIALLAGCLAGCINGLLISSLRVVPFIVTLGTMRLYLGVAKQIANETTVRPNRLEQVPDWLSNFLSIREQALWFGFPAGVWLTLFLAVVLAAVLRYTVFGRYVFALGSNESTARLCGINVHWNKVAVYTLAGFFVGVAGLYQFSRLSVGNPTSGIGLELNVIAAVVIGGGSLSGGRGSVLGTLTGAAIMAVITSGCTQLGLKNPVQDIILGVIIVAAVTLDQLRQRRLVN